MYKFHLTETFPGGPEVLLERQFRSFDDMVRHMPNINRVQIVSRRELGCGREELVAEFHAERAIPVVARPFVKSSEIMWTEIFTIDPDRLVVDWVIRTPIMTEYIKCSGTSICRECGEGSVLVIDGDFEILTPPDSMLDSSLGRSMARVMEPFIGNMVTKNMKKFFQSFRRELEREFGCQSPDPDPNA